MQVQLQVTDFVYTNETTGVTQMKTLKQNQPLSHLFNNVLVCPNWYQLVQ